ncbi:MAG: type III polyketide synthase [Planctomycetota bacterium]
MAMYLHGLGVSTPEHRLTADNAIELAHRVCCENTKHERVSSVVHQKSGVAERRTCVPFTDALAWEEEPEGPTIATRAEWYEANAGPLAVESARLALSDAGVAGESITHLVTVTCTGFEAPGVDVALIHQLRLPATVQRVQVGFMGCHGAINGLRVANGLLAAEPDAKVLLVATELCSVHYAFRWDLERMAGNALFADGSGALVATSSPQQDSGWRLAATGSCLLPGTESLLSWRVRDHGFEMGLSAKLPDAILAHLGDWLPRWLGEQGLSLGDVGCWAIHPGGPRILTASRAALGLPDVVTAASEDVLRDHGNMSSATLLFVLKRLQQATAQPPCVMLGFGPGVVAEAALWR